MSIAAACLHFTADLEARQIEPGTRKKYRQLFERLQAWSATHSVVVLRQMTAQAVRDFRSTWGVAPVTSNKMLERCRSFFRFCVDSGWMDGNPAAAVRRAKESQLPTLPFTQDEIVRILRAADAHCEGKTGVRRLEADRLRALVLVLRWSGLRISDAVMLRRSQIDAEGSILLRRQVKTLVPVRIPLPPIALAALEALPPGDWFFAPGDGNAATRAGNWRRRLRWLFVQASVEHAHAHRFRDTRAVELLQHGVPIERVAVLLGHDSVRTTEKHYSPWVQSRANQLAEDVRKTWGGTPQGHTSATDEDRSRKTNNIGMVSRAGLD